MSAAAPYLTPAHEAFRQSVRRFLDEAVIPYAAQWESQRTMPRSAWERFAGEGLLGLNHAEAVGGGGKDIFHSVIFLEELGRAGFGGVRFAVALHCYMATTYLASSGSDYLDQSFLAPAIRGERIAALAITEANAGSDMSMVATSLREDGDDLVIDGEKRFIVNGGMADFFVTAVRTEGHRNRRGQGGLSLCIVERDRAGVQIKPNPCMAWRASAIADVAFERVRIPRANMIGRANTGFTKIMKNMQLERLAAGVSSVGDAENCLRMTWKHLQSRAAFNTTLSKMQTVRHTMAGLLTEIEATRQLAYHAAWMFARDPLAITECSMIKLKGTELARTVAEHCAHLFGAEGCCEDAPIARIMRDAQAATVAAGASEVMRDIIAQSALEEQR